MDLAPTLVRAEAAMRNGFACAGDGAGNEFAATFDDLSSDELVVAFNLARRVIIEALSDASPDGMADEDFTTLGANIARGMAWTQFQSGTIQVFLRQVWNREAYTTDDDETFVLAMISGGYLVLGLAPTEDWPTFLDELLDRILHNEGPDGLSVD